MLVREEQRLKQRSDIFDIPSLIVTLVKLLQSSKQSLPISFMEPGSTIFSREEQRLKQFSDIFNIPSFIVTLVKLLHSQKQSLPISRRELGSTTLTREGHSQYLLLVDYQYYTL